MLGSVYVRCNQGPQEQEEQADVVVTGKTVPNVVPSGVGPPAVSCQVWMRV